jgi:predicted dehydrogenase
MDKAQTQHPEAKPYVEYRELLQQSGLDAVLIASPDHHHAPMLYAALDAKKDVYLEKPLSTSLQQSLDMIKAVRKTAVLGNWISARLGDECEGSRCGRREGHQY